MKCILGELEYICTFKNAVVSARKNACRSEPCNLPVPRSHGAKRSTCRGADTGGYTWSDTTIVFPIPLPHCDAFSYNICTLGVALFSSVRT